MRLGDLFTDPAFATTIAIAFGSLLCGLACRDRKELAKGFFTLASLLAVVAIGIAIKPNNISLPNEQPTQDSVDTIAADEQAGVETQLQEKVVDDSFRHDNSPQIKAQPISERLGFRGLADIAPIPEEAPAPRDNDNNPPPTFDPESTITPPQNPSPRGTIPQRQMPVTLRAVPAPDDHTPQGKPQTFGQTNLVWVRNPDGTWKLVPTTAPKSGK